MVNSSPYVLLPREFLENESCSQLFSDALGLLQMRDPQARKISQIIVSRYFVTHRINHSKLFRNHIDDYVQI